MFDAVAKNTVAPLVLRLALAAIFIYHGSMLVQADWGRNALPGSGQPVPVQVAVAWGQLIGGVAMAIGFLTRLAALGLIVIMAGAIALVHWEHGFDAKNHGYEYNVLIIAACLALVLTGPGNFAVDRIFRRRRGQI